MPAASFAQANAPITRAEVRAELIQMENAGYHVGDGDQTTYPAPVEAAEARIHVAHGSASGYGGVAAGSSDSGRPAMAQADWNAMYSHP